MKELDLANQKRLNDVFNGIEFNGANGADVDPGADGALRQRKSGSRQSGESLRALFIDVLNGTKGDSSANEDKHTEKSETAKSAIEVIRDTAKLEPAERLEYVGTRVRAVDRQTALKELVETLLTDTERKEFLQNIKALGDRAKDDELDKARVDAVYTQLTDLLYGKSADGKTSSPIPEKARIALAKDLMADLAHPELLTRESNESKKRFMQRRWEYIFEPDEVAKRIVQQVIGRPEKRL